MSRGGRGGGRGGRQRGPDMSWEDDPIVLEKKKPEPLFPELDPKLSVPRPLSEDELERVNDYITVRDSIRNGPFYAILEPKSFTDNKGRLNERAGFDPFTGMEKYGSRFDKPKRTMPDFSGREYNLEFFPRELWSSLDPKRTNPAWRTRLSSPPPIEPSSPKKRKAPGRPPTTKPNPLPRLSSEEPSDSESDAPIASKRRKPPLKRRERDRQKAGLEAEDDIPDMPEQNEDPDGGDDDEQVDTEFEDSELEGGDYDAEQHFDDGMDDEGDEGGEEASYE